MTDQAVVAVFEMLPGHVNERHANSLAPLRGGNILWYRYVLHHLPQIREAPYPTVAFGGRLRHAHAIRTDPRSRILDWCAGHLTAHYWRGPLCDYIRSGLLDSGVVPMGCYGHVGVRFCRGVAVHRGQFTGRRNQHRDHCADNIRGQLAPCSVLSHAGPLSQALTAALAAAAGLLAHRRDLCRGGWSLPGIRHLCL